MRGTRLPGTHRLRATDQCSHGILSSYLLHPLKRGCQALTFYCVRNASKEHLFPNHDGVGKIARAGIMPCDDRIRGPLQARAEHVRASRSEEHTSELQSQFHLVCRLLLEKKHRRYCAIAAHYMSLCVRPR